MAPLSLKQVLLAGFLGAALVLLPLAPWSEVTADDAIARIQPPQNKLSVRLKDMSEDDSRFVRRMAARVSKDSAVVLYLGSDQNKIDDVRMGASMANDEGFPVRGMILATGDESYTVYVDGYPAAESVRELGASTPHWVRNAVVEGYQLMQEAQANVDRRKPMESQN